MLVVSGPDDRIVQASAHAGSWLGRPLEAILLGPIGQLGGTLGAQVREAASQLEAGPAGNPVALPCSIATGQADRPLEAWIHRPGPGLLSIDLLPPGEGPLCGPAARPGIGLTAGPSAEPTFGPTAGGANGPTPEAALLEHLEDTIHALSQAHSIEELSQLAARRMQALCGHEEVRIVRYAHDGQAAVVASARADGASPASPAAWRAELHAPAPGLTASGLQGLQGLDVLVDAWDEPVPMLPRQLAGAADPAAQAQVLSGSTLRSPAPGRLAQLREAGVRAHACAALHREGQPWGAIVCLDSRHARPLAAAHRYAFGLVVEAVATRLTAIESAGRAEVAEQVRRLQALLVDATTHEGDWRGALLREPQRLLDPLQASGAALVHAGEALACAGTPAPAELQALAAWIDARSAAPVWSSDDLAAEDFPLAGRVAPGTALLAARLSLRQPDFVLWFRQSTPAARPGTPAWTGTDLTRAASFAEMLVDLMVQADAVRLLMAELQLERLQAKVARSREAVVVCDAQGRVTLANQAFGELAGRAPPGCATLEELLGLLAPTVVARRLAAQVRAEQRSARSVLALPRQDGSMLPVAVRAEPVLARSGGLLGMIFLVEDLTAARLAEDAWTQLQALLGTSPQEGAGQEADPVVSAIRTHASLAAMDMADTTRTPGLAPLLQEVGSATQRAIALYGRLTGLLQRGGPGPGRS